MAKRASSATVDEPASKRTGRPPKLNGEQLAAFRAVVLVHPANVQDRDGAAPVVEQAMAKYPTLKKLYVDAGYSGECARALRKTYRLDVEVVRRPGKEGAWTDAQLPLFATAATPATPFPILPRRWVVERNTLVGRAAASAFQGLRPPARRRHLVDLPC